MLVWIDESTHSDVEGVLHGKGRIAQLLNEFEFPRAMPLIDGYPGHIFGTDEGDHHPKNSLPKHLRLGRGPWNDIGTLHGPSTEKDCHKT